MDASLATRYVDAAIANLRAHDIMRMPDPAMPMAMRDVDLPNRDDWVAWKPIPSTVTPSDVADLERLYGGMLPTVYVDFLQYQHFYDLTERGVRFECHIAGKWKERLASLYRNYKPHFPAGSQLVPFGHETFMDAGPVCFDFAARLPDGDCPVVFWDHEWINTKKEIRPLFSSATKMFECLLFIAQCPIDFFYHHLDSDDDNVLPQKRRFLSQFLRIDPASPIDYWTTWGVSPDA